MSARARVTVAVAVAAVAAAAATVAITALTSGDGSRRDAAPRLCPNGPPLDLDLGVRTDAEAVALTRAAALYRRGERAASRRILERRRSLQAAVGAALAAWPRGTFAALRRLARAHPESALVRLHLGHVLACRGRLPAARREWRAAKRLQPDTRWAVRAGDLLHPEYVGGLPTFVPSFPFPARLARLSPARQLRALARSARGRDVRARLLYGIALQRLERPRSAERLYASAAALAPGNAEAQVAAAVGRFDKDRPARAFSVLGPLVRKFPRAPSVRFHLGLLLLWIGRLDEGRRQLVLARAQAPRSALAREAGRLLLRLEIAKSRTNDG